MDTNEHLLKILPDEPIALLGLLKFLDLPIVIADQEGNVVFWNLSAVRVFQYTEDEILHQPLVTIIPERFKEAHSRAFNAFTSIQSPRTFLTSKVFGSSLDLFGLRKDGSEFPCQIVVVAYKSKDRVCFLGVISPDNSRRPEADALLQLNLDIRKKIEEMDVQAQPAP